MEYLFVYGTLMRKYTDNPFRLLLEKNTRFVGEAFTYGKLFLVDYYPALIHNSASENHKVYGEIVKINTSTGILKLLDEYEDYFEKDETNSLYIRKVADCFSENDGKKVPCHIYFYNQKVDNLKFLNNGRFFIS